MKAWVSKLVDLLVDTDLFKDVADLYHLLQKSIAEFERMGEKSAENLLIPSKKVKKQRLLSFLYALGIREVGETTALNLSMHFSSLDEFIAQ